MSMHEDPSKLPPDSDSAAVVHGTSDCAAQVPETAVIPENATAQKTGRSIKERYAAVISRIWTISVQGASVWARQFIARLPRNARIPRRTLASTRLRLALLAVALLPASYLIYQFLFVRKPAVDTSMLIPDVHVQTLAAEKLVHELRTPGTITFYEKAAVSSRILGRVESIFVEQGAMVRKGERLARMETFELVLKQRSAQGNVQQALAQLNLQRSRYGLARRDVERQIATIERSQSDILESKAQYLNARQTLQNKKELYDMGGVAGTELRQTYAAYLGAASRLFQTRKDYIARIIGFRDQDLSGANIAIPSAPAEKKKAFVDFNTQVDFHSVRASEAAYQNALIELENINLMLREATITSPLSGVVAARSIEIGEEIKQGEPLFTIVRMDKLVVESQIPEEELKHVSSGVKAGFTVDARDGHAFEGTIYLISPIVDVKTRTAQIRILFENKENLAPGMFARTRIAARQKERALAVPESAIINRRRDGNGQQTAEVFIIQNDLSLKKTVVLGDVYGERVEVLAGLKAGETIATENVDILKDGAKVRIRPAARNGGVQK